MPEREALPGECDVREWSRAALEEYTAELRRFRPVWARTGEKYFGVASPHARLLDAEMFVVSVARFRNFYDGLPARLAPYFLDTPGATLFARLN